MARINLDAFLNLNQVSVNKTNKKVKDALEAAGRDGGKNLTDSLAKEVERAAPRVRKAFNRVAEATAGKTRATREDTKVQNKANQVAARALQIEEDIASQKHLNNSLSKVELDLQKRVNEERATAAKTAAEVAKREAAQDAAKRKSIKTNEQLRLSELKIKDLRLAGDHKAAKQLDKELQPLRKQKAKDASALATADKDLAAIRSQLQRETAGVTAAEDDLKNVRRGVADGRDEVNKAETELARVRKEAQSIAEQAVKTSEDVERQARRETEALRSLADAHAAESKGRKKKRGSVVGNILTDIPFVPGGRAGAAIGTGVLVVLGSAAEAAVTASQSLALLPAITAAAGAGFATLAIGTQGFGDAIKDMGDPEKFAAALQSLSPAAQQAALEIQSLVNGPLKELKMATQETLFDGVAQQLHDATGTFGPMLQGLTTSVAGSLNNMFDNLLGELSSANSLASINRIIDDITKAFQNLAPAVAPFTDAILKITETGASFLPGMAQGVTDLANEFSNFITGAQQDGSLANFMQKGIDAAAALGRFILDLGQEIYETFGNTSPEEFASTLDSVKGAVIGIAEAIVGASNAVNKFLAALTPIADAVGGWDNLFQIAIGVFVGAKMVSAIASVGKLVGALGGVKLALGGLPAIATTAAAGITSAFATIAIPTWLGNLLANGIGGSLGLPEMSIGDTLKAPFTGWGSAWEKTFGDPGTSPSGGVDPSTGLPREQSTAPSNTRDSGGLPPSTAPGADQFRPHPGRAPFGSGQNPPSSYSPHAVPGPPDTRSDSTRIQDELNKLNPNDYMPAIPAMPSASSGYRNGPEGTGMYEVDPQEVQNAYQQVIEQSRDVRDAHMQLVALQRSGIATDLEILKAKEKLADEQHDFNDSQLKLTEAQIGKLDKANKGMQDIGLALDDDFGASRGLAGLAENLVKFVASLAAAPVIGMLAPIAAQGDGRAGLLGLLPQAPGTGLAASANALIANAQGGQGVGQSGSTSYLMPTGGGAAYAGVPLGSNMDVTSQAGLGLLRQLGLKGTTYGSHTTDGASSDREVDVTDPVGGYGSAALTQFAQFARQNPNLFEEFIYSDPTTGQKTGIRSGQLVGPGTSQPGYYADDWAGHQDHAHIEPAKGGGLGGAQEASGSLNALAVAAQSATTALTGGAGGTSLWDKVAQAESGGNWQNQDTGNNGHFGGLQFSPETWKAFGGIDLTGQSNPANTSREQQIEVANRTAFSGYNGQKPQGLGAWEAITSGMVPGVSVNTPASAFGAVPRGPGWMPQSGGVGSPGLPLPGSVPTGGPLGTGFPNAFGPGGMPQSPAIGGPGGPLGVGQGIGAPQGGALGQGLGQATPSYKPTTPSTAPDPAWSPQGGGNIGSGVLGMALGAASSAAGVGANAFAPGSGAAAQKAAEIGQKAIERTIAFAGQIGGTLASGVQETLSFRDPDTGEDPLANSWLQRLSGALTGARPAGAAAAGKADEKSKVDPNAPQQQQGQNGQQQQGAGPPTVHVENMNVPDGQRGQNISKDLAYEAQRSWFS